MIHCILKTAVLYHFCNNPFIIRTFLTGLKKLQKRQVMILKFVT